MKWIILLLFLSSFTLKSQDIPIGTWRTHFSYNKVRHVEAGANSIYAASVAGLFIYSLDDNSITTVTKLNGLQEENISTLHYNETNSILFIGYESGNLDILENTDITNIDLTTDSQVLGSKAINNIITAGNFIYLLTDFGLIKMDAQTYAVTETVRELGAGSDALTVHQGAILGDSIFLATAEGILATDLINNINMADPNSWKRFDIAEGLFEDDFQFIVNFQNGLLAGSAGQGIYRYSNGWSEEDILSEENFIRAKVSDQQISIVTESGAYVLDPGLNVIPVQNDGISEVLDLVTLNNNFYVADSENGTLRLLEGEIESILPSGPVSNDVFRLSHQTNGMYGFAGGFNGAIRPNGQKGAFYLFNNGTWKSTESDSDLPFEDVVDGVYQNTQSRTVLALAGQGLLIINEDGSREIIDDDTPGATLVNIDNTDKGVIVPSLHAEPDGIWLLNSDTLNPLHFYSNDNTWSAFPLADDEVYEITGDSRQLYMLSRRGIVVFEKSSGSSRLLTTTSGEGGLTGNSVSVVAIDREGLIWVGTDEGISVLTNPFALMEGAVDAVEPVFENRLLLSEENITAIAVDGGNRKWIGTNSGAWLFNPQADRQLFNFTIDNSPLSNNRIIDIEIDPITGEVFFATEAGIISYREGATRTSDTHSEVKVFPNPVTADFVGTVGISGLAEDVQIRITDASGKLIWRTRAAGGTATWNARDYNGNRAASGIYYIFSSDDAGEETFLGKIAVVN
ncbi:MAG: T9SS type A sorting domain-containing protein [Bacteroidota bacterium]